MGDARDDAGLSGLSSLDLGVVAMQRVWLTQPLVAPVVAQGWDSAKDRSHRRAIVGWLLLPGRSRAGLRQHL